MSVLFTECYSAPHIDRSSQSNGAENAWDCSEAPIMMKGREGFGVCVCVVLVVVVVVGGGDRSFDSEGKKERRPFPSLPFPSVPFFQGSRTGTEGLGSDRRRGGKGAERVETNKLGCEVMGGGGGGKGAEGLRGGGRAAARAGKGWEGHEVMGRERKHCKELPLPHPPPFRFIPPREWKGCNGLWNDGKGPRREREGCRVLGRGGKGVGRAVK